MGRIEFVGVDGCPAGWFSVGFDTIGGYELKVFPAFSELVNYYDDAKLVLVDIPIGLPEGPGGRECDTKARKQLGSPRSSSVFSAPTRQTVRQAAESPAAYCCANATEQAIAGKGISQQAFRIAPKIAQVDRLLRCRDSTATPEVREVHPEVCFWALNGQKAMQFNKKEPQGEKQRNRILDQFEARTRAMYGEACRRFVGGGVGKDDILDALVAAVTARCGFGRLRTIPECPPTDCKGLPMEMVYWEA